MHLLTGSVGFLALIVACFVFARRFATLGQRRWTAFSALGGIVVLAAIVGISAGSQQAAFIIALFIGGVIGWAWFSALCLYLMGESDRSVHAN
jgi:hypothetical protein